MKFKKPGIYMVVFPNGKWAIQWRRWFSKPRYLDLSRDALNWIPQLHGDFKICLGDEDEIRQRYTMLGGVPKEVE